MHDTSSTDSPTPAPGAPRAPVDDINIPVVAVAVALFVAALALVIGALQVLFKDADTREMQSKTLAQEDPRTELGKLLDRQRAELTVPPKGRVSPRAPAATTAATTGATAASTSAAATAPMWIPIDTAMRVVSREYQSGGQP